jgi:hypothetical protein
VVRAFVVKNVMANSQRNERGEEKRSRGVKVCEEVLLEAGEEGTETKKPTTANLAC